MNRRRLLIAACALAAFPARGLAQRPVAVPRVGLLWLDTGPASILPLAFRDGLRAQGYVDGKNIEIVGQFLVDRYDLLAEAAGRLVKQNVDVIVAYGGTATLAASKATKTIPIVMVTSNDPVRLGVVASLSKPGGNVTGVTFLGQDLIGKRLEILREIAPKARRIGVLVNPESASEMRNAGRWQAAARTLNIEVQLVEIRTPGEIDAALSAAARQGVGALVVLASSFFTANRNSVVNAVAKARLPALYGSPDETDAGGLVSYGPSLPEGFQRAAVYVDRILKGARPADLPVEQPTKIELVINLRAAKALGITIPPPMLLRADRVIE